MRRDTLPKHRRAWPLAIPPCPAALLTRRRCPPPRLTTASRYLPQPFRATLNSPGRFTNACGRPATVAMPPSLPVDHPHRHGYAPPSLQPLPHNRISVSAPPGPCHNIVPAAALLPFRGLADILHLLPPIADAHACFYIYSRRLVFALWRFSTHYLLKRTRAGLVGISRSDLPFTATTPATHHLLPTYPSTTWWRRYNAHYHHWQNVTGSGEGTFRLQLWSLPGRKRCRGWIGAKEAVGISFRSPLSQGRGEAAYGATICLPAK